MRKSKRKALRLLFTDAGLFVILSLMTGLTGCERPLRVSLDGGNPPTFTFGGGGELQRVAIFEITPDGRLPPKGSAFWVLFPKGVVKAGNSPKITYGIVPDGFYQKVPVSGTAPPLQEGKVYGFGAETRGAPGGDIWFTIRGGKSIQVPKTDPADPE